MKFSKFLLFRLNAPLTRRRLRERRFPDSSDLLGPSTASDHSLTSDSSEHSSKESDYSLRSDTSDFIVLSPSKESYYSPTSDFPAKEKQTDHIPQKQEVKRGTRKDATYKIKEIQYLGKKKQIVLQNENGPCPLIAICNILVLKNYTDLYHPDTFEVSEARLLDLVANALIDTNYVGDEMLKKIDDATNRLSNIVDGINVDLKFWSIDEFLFTPELSIFGLLNIPLYHGWLVDPQDYETSTAIGCKSYDELSTELVVMETHANARSGPFSGECSVHFSTALTPSVSLDSPAYEGESRLGEYYSEGTDTNKLTPKKGEVIRRFLNDNASQLTCHGLFSLKQGIQEGELCAFFRNNHFSTMLKYQNELYLLVTDQGYLTQRDVVWEKLNEVSGNSVFMTGDFQVFNHDRSETRKWDRSNAITNTADFISRTNNSLNQGLEIDPDLKMAMDLQQQELGEAHDQYFT